MAGKDSQRVGRCIVHLLVEKVIFSNPRYPAFQHFSTACCGSWLWRNAVTHASLVRLKAVALGLRRVGRAPATWLALP
jgi:hypothetical protein